MRHAALIPEPHQVLAGGAFELFCAHQQEELHSVFFFYVAPFTFDLANGCPYTPGQNAPTEVSVAETIAAFGRVWQPYYPPSVTLYGDAIFTTVDGRLMHPGSRLGTIPQAIAAGTGPEYQPGVERAARIFEVRSTGIPARSGAPRPVVHLIGFVGIPGPQQARSALVLPTQGGIDERDRAVMAYVSGVQTGIRGADGTRFLDQARVTDWVAW